MRTVTRRNLEAALAAVETSLAVKHDSIDLLSDRACLLAELGETERAKQQYLEVLQRDPRHFSTLNNLAVLLYNTGYTSAARVAYTAAITHHPNNPLGHTNFADLLAYDGKLQAAREHYEAALRIDPAHFNAHRGLAVVLRELGDEEQARQHRTIQYWNRPIESFPYMGNGEPVPILLLMSASVGNLPWRGLIDNKFFLPITVATEFFDRGQPLPPHRLVFNTIGDADVCRPALEAARSLLTRTTAPVVNSPDAVLDTGRMSNAQRFAGVPGVVTPRIVELPHAVLSGPRALEELSRHGLNFPLLLRRPGFHTGQYFEFVESPAVLAAALARLPGEDLMVIEYLDARGPDGKARKYRVMCIDGQLYPLHLAISESWKVHYFTAEMSGNTSHQAEEAAFLTDMPGTLGPKAMRAIEHIQAALGLDYGGMDFALGREGEILLFEANATMLIKAPGPESEWDYRRGPIGRALDATQSMLRNRAEVRALAHV